MSEPFELIIVVDSAQFWFEMDNHTRRAKLIAVSTYPKESQPQRQRQSGTAGGRLASVLPIGWTIDVDWFWSKDGPLWQ